MGAIQGKRIKRGLKRKIDPTRRSPRIKNRNAALRIREKTPRGIGSDI
jgi:hypothetical protein